MTESDTAAGIAVVAHDFRSARAQQLAQVRQRHKRLADHYPDVEPAQLAAITDDRFWGPDELWRHALEPAPQPSPAPNGQKPRRARFAPRDANDTVRPAEPTDSPVVLSNQGDSDGFARDAAPNPARRGRFRRRGGRTAGETTAPESAPEETGADVVREELFESFPVPPAGSRLHAGRLRSWITRLLLWAGPLILIGGVAYSCGVDKGSTRMAAPAVVTPDEATTWHLSTFEQQQAAGFGVAYLQLCLTHPDPTNSAALDARAAALAQMSSDGVAAGCGWDDTGAPQTPSLITWAGTATPVPAAYQSGTAAHLSFLAVMPGNQTTTIDLAIWASSTTGTASFRVVSNPALLPSGPVAQAPTASAPANVDDDLATSLPASVLSPFLAAWAASNSVQLSLVLTSDATAATTQGLQGQVSNPLIDTTVVGINKGKAGAYRDGDQVTAFVTVEWTTGAGHGVVKNNYAIALHRVASRWLVQNITGGAFDTQGGGAIPTVTPSSVITYTPNTAPTSGR